MSNYIIFSKTLSAILTDKKSKTDRDKSLAQITPMMLIKKIIRRVLLKSCHHM